MYCKRYSDNAGPGGAPAVVPVGGPSDLLRREGRVWAPPRSSDCNMNRKAIPRLREGSDSPAKYIRSHRPNVPKLHKICFVVCSYLPIRILVFIVYAQIMMGDRQ
jgi:hypothetical protein